MKPLGQETNRFFIVQIEVVLLDLLLNETTEHG